MHERASTDPATSGMGTTMTVALVEPNGDITFGHVGDSRALRPSRRPPRAAHRRPLARRRARPPRRALGARRRDPPAALGDHARARHRSRRRRRRVHRRPEAGDVYLICSDGLSDMVAGTSIEEVLNQHRGNLDETAKALVKAANRGGGDDNITAVLFEIVDGDAAGRRGAGRTDARVHAPESGRRGHAPPRGRRPAATAARRHDGRLGSRDRDGARGAGT